MRRLPVGATLAVTKGDAMAIVEHERPRTARPRIGGKYLSLTTYRKDGSPVATPVWFVDDGERYYAITSASSYKVQRIRRNPAVTIAECGPSGKLRGEPIAAHAELLPAGEHERIDRLMAAKYRVDRILVLPLYRLALKLQRKPYGGDEAYLALTPD
jgi:PPOX class probable F420-dependent enzyme